MNTLNTEANLKRIIRSVKENGPRNAAKVARETDIPATTVRYSLNNLLKDRGTWFTAGPDYDLLGLDRILMSLRFKSASVVAQESALHNMAKTAYLEWYGKSLPRGDYFVTVALPPEYKREYKEMMNRLVESGILTSFESYRMDWLRHRSLNENDYWFKRGSWNVNWEGLGDTRTQTEVPSMSRRGRWHPDKTDVSILGELQKDATQKLSDLSRKLRQTYRTIYYHYNEHVIDEGLIKDFIVFPDLNRKKDRRTGMLHFLRSIQPERVPEAEELFESIPFTFVSGFGQEQRVYTAYTVLPIPEVTNMLEYLSHRITDFKEKYSFELISLPHSQWYPIPSRMMDKENQWRFDGEKALQNLTLGLRSGVL